MIENKKVEIKNIKKWLDKEHDCSIIDKVYTIYDLWKHYAIDDDGAIELFKYIGKE